MVFYTLLLRSRLNNIDYRSTQPREGESEVDKNKRIAASIEKATNMRKVSETARVRQAKSSGLRIKGQLFQDENDDDEAFEKRVTCSVEAKSEYDTKRWEELEPEANKRCIALKMSQRIERHKKRTAARKAEKVRLDDNPSIKEQRQKVVHAPFLEGC